MRGAHELSKCHSAWYLEEYPKKFERHFEFRPGFCTASTLQLRKMSLPSYTSCSQLYCGICTQVLENPQQRLSRNLGCCGRSVCGECIQVCASTFNFLNGSGLFLFLKFDNLNLQENPRFGVYCPFCQSIAKSDKDGDDEVLSFRPLPPSYTPAPNSHPPPSYRLPSSSPSSSLPNKVLHCLQRNDTILSLPLLYKLPTHVVRNHSHLFLDHLLHARRTIKITGPPCNGPSLSDVPTEEEQEQDAEKSKIKRFQLKTKCGDIDSAEVYLKDSGWNEDLAEKNWLADERWARENPMMERSTGGKIKEVVDKRGKWGLRAFGY